MQLNRKKFVVLIASLLFSLLLPMASFAITLEEVLSGSFTDIFPIITFDRNELKNEFKKLALQYHRDKLSDDDKDVLAKRGMDLDVPFIKIQQAHDKYLSFIEALEKKCTNIGNNISFCPACSISAQTNCIKIGSDIYHLECWDNCGLEKALLALKNDNVAKFEEIFSHLFNDKRNKAWLAYIDKLYPAKERLGLLMNYFATADSDYAYKDGINYLTDKLKENVISPRDAYEETMKQITKNPNNKFARDVLDISVKWDLRSFSSHEILNAITAITADEPDWKRKDILSNFVKLKNLSDNDFQKIETLFGSFKDKYKREDFLSYDNKNLAINGKLTWAIALIDRYYQGDWTSDKYDNVFYAAGAEGKVEEVYTLLCAKAGYYEAKKLASAFSDLSRQAKKCGNSNIEKLAKAQEEKARKKK